MWPVPRLRHDSWETPGLGVAANGAHGTEIVPRGEGNGTRAVGDAADWGAGCDVVMRGTPMTPPPPRWGIATVVDSRQRGGNRDRTGEATHLRSWSTRRERRAFSIKHCSRASTRPARGEPTYTLPMAQPRLAFARGSAVDLRERAREVAEESGFVSDFSADVTTEVASLTAGANPVATQRMSATCGRWSGRPSTTATLATSIRSKSASHSATV